MGYYNDREERIRKKAYEIWSVNQALGIKTDSISDWLRASDAIEKEDRRELKKRVKHSRETWL